VREAFLARREPFEASATVRQDLATTKSRDHATNAK